MGLARLRRMPDRRPDDSSCKSYYERAMCRVQRSVRRPSARPVEAAEATETQREAPDSLFALVMSLRTNPKPGPARYIITPYIITPSATKQLWPTKVTVLAYGIPAPLRPHSGRANTVTTARRSLQSTNRSQSTLTRVAGRYTTSPGKRHRPRSSVTPTDADSSYLYTQRTPTARGRSYNGQTSAATDSEWKRDGECRYVQKN